MSESIERFVGIDVSKGSLDVFADPSSPQLPGHCGYDGAALKSLCDAVAQLAPTLVVMEASGGLEQRVAAELAARGVPLAVVNPRQVRNFARASSGWTKTWGSGCATPMSGAPRTTCCKASPAWAPCSAEPCWACARNWAS